MEKVKGVLTNNKKVVVIVSSIIVCIVVATSVFLLTNKETKKISSSKFSTVIEYGEKIEPSNYLVVEDGVLPKDIKTTTNIKNEDNKEYPSIGKYEIVFTYQKEKVVVNVEVKDTVAPVFNACNSVEFVKGTDFNYGEYIIATDLQEVSYEFKKDSVDVNTVGEYTLKVIATDKSNNKANKDIKVKVLDTVDTTTNEVTTTIDEKGNVKTTVTERPKVNTPNTGTSNGSSNNGTTNKPSNPSTPQTPSTPDTPTTPPVEKPHQHYASFISPLFDTVDEYRAWAENYLFSDENTQYSGYGGSRCSCGKYGVTHFY